MSFIEPLLGCQTSLCLNLLVFFFSLLSVTLCMQPVSPEVSIKFLVHSDSSLPGLLREGKVGTWGGKDRCLPGHVGQSLGAKQSSCSGGSVDPFCLSRPPTHSLGWPDHPEGAILVGAANYSTLAQGLAQGEGT